MCDRNYLLTVEVYGRKEVHSNLHNIDFVTSVIYVEEIGDKSYTAVVNSAQGEHAARLGRNVAILTETSNDTGESKELVNQDFDTLEEATAFLHAYRRRLASEQ